MKTRPDSSQTRGRGPLQRLASTDIVVAEEVLKNAALLMVPEDQTQRRAFEALMPWMYLLRNRGFSWAQLTDLLTQCGFRLQTSTVRTYYSEMLASRLDVCQARMNEQLVIFDEIRKETRGTELSGITERVSSVLAAQRKSTEGKVDSILGLQKHTDHNTNDETRRPTPDVQPSMAGRGGLRTQKRDLQRQSSIVGNAHGPAADAPVIPMPSPNTSGRAEAPSSEGLVAKPPVESATPSPASNTGYNAKFACMKLQPGVVPLKPREGVPEVVYKAGRLEHPAIPGLPLELNERLYGAALEYKSTETGEVFTESPTEKRFRLTWRTPTPRVPTRTQSTFVQMDPSVFRRLPGTGTSQPA